MRRDGCAGPAEQQVSIHASVKDATPCLWKALLMTLLNCNFANDKVEKQ